MSPASLAGEIAASRRRSAGGGPITVQSGAGASATAATITPALPASVISGDLLLIFICAQVTTPTFTSTGYTQINLLDSASAGDRFVILSKTAGSSESAPVVNDSTSAACVAMVVRVRNWDPAGGPAQTTSQFSTTTTASIDPPTTGSVKIACAHRDPNATGGNAAWSGGPTSLGEIVNGSAAYLTCAYKLEDTTGAMAFSYNEGGSAIGLEAVIFSIAPL